MPVKAAPMVQAIYSWTGVYIGISGGGANGEYEYCDVGGVPALCTGGFKFRGGFVGGQAGVNWQINQFVVGFEGDGSWANIRRHQACAGVFNPAFQCNSEVEAFSTVRGRVGYAFTTGLPILNNVLIYGTGGFAATRLVRKDVSPAGPVLNADATVSGWTAGAGIEVGWGQWSVKGEWLHIDPRKTIIGPNVVGAGFTPNLQIDARYDIFRVGLNYRFGQIGL